MQGPNMTTVNEFILVGFSIFYKFQNVLFSLVLPSYIICVLGNLAVIILIKTESIFHKPMYLFISTFAVLEIMFISVTVPKLLTILIQVKKTITFFGCCAQLYLFHALGETECFLLVLMVFDRHLAINNPLRYSTIMNNTFCRRLALFPWLAGFFVASFPTFVTVVMEFCGPNVIDHFFCDLAPVQNLACSDPYNSNLVSIVAASISVVLPFIIIVILYIQIVVTVLKIKSQEGKRKAFSTCSSHLIVICLFYGTAIIVYVRPKGGHFNKFLALMYTVVTPLLNPFIYTFRNQEVKCVCRKLIKQYLTYCSG